MKAQLSADTKAFLWEHDLFVIIDESGLISSFKRDRVSELMQDLRQSAEPDGGINS